MIKGVQSVSKGNPVGATDMLARQKIGAQFDREINKTINRMRNGIVDKAVDSYR